eukprot:TRINITY_DN9279_c0_g1_i1.p1 TRINITY_DN9279_c0_g1~~TRINITY_DN9279_c0_g1_i1.p1  ORF type:complete len:207 (+),score=61.52 TRINITY_DN9279_c0_g1_i1:24-623(+)
MTTLRFNNNPDQQILTDLKSLNALGEDNANQLIQIVAEFLINQQASQLLQDVNQFAQTAQAPLQTVKNISRAVLMFFKGALRNNMSHVHVKEDLESIGIDGGIINKIVAVWRDNYGELSSTLVGNTLQINKLLDMEWRFGITVANKELHSVGSTFLQVKLTLDKGNNQNDEVFMELTLPQFYQLLREMERAKSTLEVFS